MKLQIPSAKLQGNFKHQTPKVCQSMRSLDWSLKFGASLVFGCWSFDSASAWFLGSFDVSLFSCPLNNNRNLTRSARPWTIARR
jgi:hypothetical protein